MFTINSIYNVFVHLFTCNLYVYLHVFVHLFTMYLHIYLHVFMDDLI